MIKNITKETDMRLKEITDKVPENLRESAITQAGVMLKNICTLESNIRNKLKLYPNIEVVKRDIYYYNRLMMTINSDFDILSSTLPDSFISSRVYKKVRDLIRELEMETEKEISRLEDRNFKKDFSYYNGNKRKIKKKFKQYGSMTILAYKMKMDTVALEKYVDLFKLDRKCNKPDISSDRENVLAIIRSFDIKCNEFKHLSKYVNRISDDDILVLMVTEAEKRKNELSRDFYRIAGYYN